jgi:hypothetical protein
MPTDTNWRVIAVALVAAIGLIVGALVVSLGQEVEATVAVVEPGAYESAASSEWKEAIDAIAPKPATTLSEYVAPKELPVTDAMARELLASYLSYKQDGVLTASEKQAAVDAIIARNIKTIVPSKLYTDTDLTPSQTNDIIAYSGTLTEILARSTEIKEYELRTFSKSIGANDINGSPTLEKAATVYAGIEQSLQKLPVPNTVRTEHLALLNRTAELQHATELMATWTGDPTQALAYMDAFVKAERDVQLTMSALYRKLAQIAQKL